MKYINKRPIDTNLYVYGVVSFSIYKCIFMLMRSLNSYVCAINTSNNTRNSRDFGEFSFQLNNTK
jgi:hypothetical protein